MEQHYFKLIHYLEHLFSIYLFFNRYIENISSTNLSENDKTDCINIKGALPLQFIILTGGIFKKPDDMNTN